MMSALVNKASRRCALLFSFSLLFLSACELIDPEEETPSFIEIKKPKLSTEANVEGSSSHEIRYAWVYVDDALQGVYELPAEVFTTKSGHRNIKLTAGIHQNAMGNERVQYPFYRTLETERKLVPDSSVTIEPEFEYFPKEDISIWFEDFDDPNEQNFIARSSSEADIGRTENSSEVFEGNGSGKVELSSQESFFLGASDAQFQFETSQEVYLEMDYKTTDTLNIGLLAKYPDNTFKRSLLNLKETRNSNGLLTWEKVYVQLTPIVGEEVNAQHFEVFVQSTLSSGATEGKILIDNFKVLRPGG